MNDVYFQYIGSAHQIEVPQKRYIVKMTQEEHEAAKKNKPDYVSVTLVDNKKIKWPGVIRKSGDSMVVINPYYEMEQYGHPGFVKLSEYELAKQTELR